MESKTYCGYVAILGRPNVGKSTLLNSLLAQKLSITSHKRQTTRHNLLGIRTHDQYQAIYVDTPGIHQGAKRALNRYMNQEAFSTIHDVDIILFMIEAGVWTKEDDMILQRLSAVEKPVVLVINKVDEFKDKAELLPFLNDVSKKREFFAIVPISAKKRDNVDRLERLVDEQLPEGPFFFPEGQLTDRREQFFIAETIREKLFRAVHQEIPYSATVVVEKIEDLPEILKIYATIFVEKKGQKVIVVGKQGEGIRQIGQNARQELEKKYDKKIYLQLWVKVKESWADSERYLRELGYRHDDES